MRAREINLRIPIELALVDDDLGGPYPPIPGDTVAATLAALGVPLGAGGSRVVLAFAEPRAWKGRAGFSPASRATLEELVPQADLTSSSGIRGWRRRSRARGRCSSPGTVSGSCRPPRRAGSARSRADLVRRRRRASDRNGSSAKPGRVRQKATRKKGA